MTRLSSADATALRELLVERAAAHGLVGCGLAVLVGDEVHEAVAGVADVTTGEPMRPDAQCLVGSTTKVYTATLVMQLVSEGRIDLDAAVRRYLPRLRLGDPDATDALTVRDLLRHTTGLGIGPYVGFGSDAGAVERYVDALATQRFVHWPGERWGYSNVGYVLAGRVVEVVTGLAWDDALRDRLLRPAGLSHTSTDLQIGRRRVARPHLVGSDGQPRRSDRWGFVDGRALGPTGSTLAATAADLVRFAQLHLSGGISLDGTRVVPEDAVAAMSQRQVAVPQGWPMGEAWCLGWYAGTWGGREMLGHTGHNVGAGSHLHLLPGAGAVAMVFNSVPGDATAAHEVIQAVAAELFGAAKPPPWLPEQPMPAERLAAYRGRYRNDAGTLVVDVEEGALRVRQELSYPELGNEDAVVRPVSPSAFGAARVGAHTARPPDGCFTPEVFFDGFDAHGRPLYAYHSVFVFRREA